MNLEQLLKLMTDKGASDLHLKPQRPPLMRIHGKLRPIDSDPLSPEALEKMLLDVLTDLQRAKLAEHMATDLGIGIHGLARFRGSVFWQRGTLAGAFRRIPFDIKPFEELNLPEVIDNFCELPMGLVLVTGPTGSGKSTTLASMIARITHTRPAHVITIEDPIEFLFADDVATVAQREVGNDTVHFAEALRNALRQDPDVIMVGEMRDPETVSTVITAAETGHLVFSTLHTNSATQSVDRILDTFPTSQQKQVRVQLEQILKGVVSMKLVERKDGQGMVPALEIMRASPRICKLIAKGETTHLHEELESSVSYYRMQSMNQSLLALLVHGTINYEEAMKQSPDPEDLSLKLRKMFPKIEQRGGDMSPSTSDFSEILELQQFRKLYEEQEEKVKLRVAEKDGRIREMEGVVGEKDRAIEMLEEQINGVNGQLEKLRGEYNRLRQEAQEKIDKLSERIKQLNQQLMAAK